MKTGQLLDPKCEVMVPMAPAEARVLALRIRLEAEARRAALLDREAMQHVAGK